MGSMELIKSQAANLVTLSTGLNAPDHNIFDIASINAHIEDSMKALPEGKTVALVAYADGEGIKGAIVGKLDSPIPGELKWTVLGMKPYSGSFTWGAGIQWSI